MLRAVSGLLLCAVMLGAAEPPKLASVLVCDGIASPTWVGTPPGQPNRLFVLEQRTGAIRVFDRAARTWQATPVLTVEPLLARANEQGLFGLAFHPAFAKNGFIYLYYTAPGGGAAGHAEIARFTIQGEHADPASKQVLLTVDKPEDNHNGGWIAFGPDHYLWLGIGDGGGGNDHHGPIGSGQNRQALLGKLLRLDVDHGQPYSIPKDNPFVDQLGKRPEIAAFGLRNPWRCSFDTATGDLWIGDVGQNAREEIDLLPAGKLGLNFGWRPREGTIATPGWEKEQTVTKATEPVLDYDRAQGRVSVTGGYVYRGAAIPGLVGQYIYADFAAQRFYRFAVEPVRGGAAPQLTEITEEVNPGRQHGNVSTFGSDSSGELFFTGWNTGRVYQIVAAP